MHPDGRTHHWIETAGLEPVQASERQVGFADQFLTLTNFLINPSLVLNASAGLALGLSFRASVFAVTAGVASALIPYAVMSRLGADLGVPGQVAARATFGLRGARFGTSAIRVVCSLYFFALNTVIGTVAIARFIEWLTGTEPSLWLTGMFFGAIQVACAVMGYQWLKAMARFVLPVKLLIMVVLLVMVTDLPGPSHRLGAIWAYPGKGEWNWPLFAIWFNASCSAWLSLVTDAADFCRYTKSRRATTTAVATAALIGTPIAASFGAAIGAASLGQDHNAFTALGQILPGGLPITLVAIMLFLDNISINSLNIYTGGLSLENVRPALGRLGATLIVSAAGIVASASQEVLLQIIAYINVIGSLFSPITGIIVVDVLILQCWRINADDLFDVSGPYWYKHGYNLRAWAVIAAAIPVYYGLVPESALRPLSVALLSGTAYYALAVFQRQARPAVEARVLSR